VIKHICELFFFLT